MVGKLNNNSNNGRVRKDKVNNKYKNDGKGNDDNDNNDDEDINTMMDNVISIHSNTYWKLKRLPSTHVAKASVRSLDKDHSRGSSCSFRTQM